MSERSSPLTAAPLHPESVPEKPLSERHLPAEPARPGHFFLLGQPERQDSQPDPRMEPVYQHGAPEPLKPLTAQQTRNYVEQGLRAAGWKNDPTIGASVYRLIHQVSEGIPSRINMVCNRLLLRCFVEQRHRITVEDVGAIVQDLPREKLITRKRRCEEPPVTPSVEVRLEEPVREKQVLEECLPVASTESAESTPPEPLTPSVTSVNPGEKARFGSQNATLPKNSPRRGTW